MADDMVSNVEQWVSFTDEALKDASAWHDTVNTIIFGNNNYAPLAGYWQAPSGGIEPPRAQAERSARTICYTPVNGCDCQPESRLLPGTP